MLGNARETLSQHILAPRRSERHQQVPLAPVHDHPPNLGEVAGPAVGVNWSGSGGVCAPAPVTADCTIGTSGRPVANGGRSCGGCSFCDGYGDWSISCSGSCRTPFLMSPGVVRSWTCSSFERSWIGLTCRSPTPLSAGGGSTV
jgi:hypothetical protein